MAGDIVHVDLSAAALALPVAARADLPGFGGWSVKDGVPHVIPPREILEQMLALRLHIDDCGPDNDEPCIHCGHEPPGPVRLASEGYPISYIPDWARGEGPVEDVGSAVEQQRHELGQQVAQTLLDVTLNLPHSRTDETEADRIGVELAARAGHDPRAAVNLWQKMEKLGGGRQPQWLSTHPDPANRLRDLQDYSQRVLPLYQQVKR